MAKCPEKSIYIQILDQTRAQNYIESNLHSDAKHITLIKDAKDMYKQLLLSVGEYVNQNNILLGKIGVLIVLLFINFIHILACSMSVFNLKLNIYTRQ